MIAIKINGVEVDIADSASVAVSRVSPYLLYDSIPATALKPPGFSFSPNNQRAFGFFEEPTAGGQQAEYKFEMYASGELLNEGFFRLLEAGTDKGYTGGFTEKIEEFFGEYQDKLLTEIDFGSLALPGVLSASPIDDLGMPAVCFPVVVNADYYGTSPGSYTGKMNDHNGTAFEANAPKVPMVFVKYLIAKIGQLTGTTITGNFLSHAAYQNLILFHTRSLDGSAIIDIAKQLPELSVESFFLELRKLPNLMLLFNTTEKTLKIDFWQDKLLAPTSIDWSSKAAKGETKVAEQNTRIQLSYQLDSGDALMKDKPTETSDYVTAQYSGQTYVGIAPVTAKFSTTLMDATTGHPIVKQQGITEVNQQLTQKCSPRLLFWAGIVAGKPTASTEVAGHSLYWNGVNGLKEKHWSILENTRASQFYLKKQILLSEIDLANLDFSKKIHLNGVDYLVAQVDYKLPLKDVSEVLLVGGV
jgi:hypothetical protein